MGYFHAFSREWRHADSVEQSLGRRDPVRQWNDGVTVRGGVLCRSYPQSPARVLDQR